MISAPCLVSKCNIKIENNETNMNIIYQSCLLYTSNINIVAIKRGKKIMVNPSPDAVLEQGDVLLAIGETKALTKLHG